MDFVGEITGLRYNATVYYIGDGYYYYSNSSDDCKVYLKCIHKNQGCQARASMPLLPVNRLVGNFISTAEHTHEPDMSYIDLLKLRKSIINRCRDEATAYRMIFDEECARFPIALSGQLGYQSMVSAMKRDRHELRDSVPSTLLQYGELLARPDHRRFSHSISGEPFFQTTLTETDGSVSIVFASRKFLNMLQNATEVHMDGTFKVVPRFPPCYQLLTVMSIHYNHAFPVFSILMERKTRSAYDSVMAHIKTVCPTVNPVSIILDFETALQGAARFAFPNSHIVGCWFHSANSLNRHARRIGLVPLMRDQANVKKVVKMAMALPLLPENKLVEGFNAICHFAESENIQQVVGRFLDYVHTTWITGVGARAFSVYNQQRMTNNDQESYHRTLLNKIGQPHPEIWNFTDGLRKQENSYLQKYESLERGQMAARNRPSTFISNDIRIKRATDQLLEQRLTTLEFLKVVSHSIDNIHNNIYNVVDIDDETPEEIGVTTNQQLPMGNGETPEEVEIHEAPPHPRGGHGQQRGRQHRGIRANRIARRGRRGVARRGRREERLGPAREEHPENERREQQAIFLSNIPIDVNDVSSDGNMEVACKTCVDNRKQYACLPCYHLDLCGSCVLTHRQGMRDHSGQLVNDIVCPRCRGAVTGYVRVFL